MIVRDMTECDIDEVHAIETEVFTQPWSKRDFSDGLNNPNYVYLVVEVDNKVIAYCGMWNIAGEGQINNVAVTLNYQDKKVGYLMLSELLLEGSKRGLEEYTLEVRVSNERAIHLYKKLGFKECGTRRNFYDLPKEDALIMWRRND